jgi:hypothetical protein
MPLPNEPVTLSPEQVNELRKQLGTMRHDINNHLSLIIAAAELIKINPESVGRMAATLTEQPGKISAHIGKFSAAFEKSLGIQPD